MRQPTSGQKAPMSVCHIGVDQYDVDANIGVHEHEHGRVQRLVVDVSIETGLPKADTLNATFDYAEIASIIEDVASNHCDLIETFAARVARACLRDPRNRTVKVRVQKPPALPKGMAWTSVVMARAPYEPAAFGAA